MFRIVTLTLIAMLAACTSTKPPIAEQAPATTTVIVKETIVDTLRITDSVFVRETESFKALQKSIDSLIARKETEKAIDLLKKQVQYYNNLDQLGYRTLQLANLLHSAGHSAEALAILESFAVYKPAINFWIDSANTLYDKIMGTPKAQLQPQPQIDQEKLEVINSLTAQIRNMKNINANPIAITNLADSLRALAPGDSVLQWLEKQLPSEIDNSDSYCEDQRKFASEKFANARKNKARATALLTEAIEALDKCLTRTPSAEMRRKVMQNREVLEKEKQGL